MVDKDRVLPYTTKAQLQRRFTMVVAVCAFSLGVNAGAYAAIGGITLPIARAALKAWLLQVL